jgi:hypothetical protein
MAFYVVPHVFSGDNVDVKSHLPRGAEAPHYPKPGMEFFTFQTKPCSYHPLQEWNQVTRKSGEQFG